MRRIDLVKLLHRRPFKPFRLTTTSKDSYDVKHPEAAIVGRRTLAVWLPPLPTLGTSPPEFDPAEADVAWIDVLHIAQIEPIRGEK
ncbi:MAG TPA: hypothetical protein VFV87_05105 [Pirellulaceae bacterium]|nr:hypothetical protein [Pirellulaceae bacterium]